MTTRNWRTLAIVLGLALGVLLVALTYVISGNMTATFWMGVLLGLFVVAVILMAVFAPD
jgi:hypothetical protein